MIVGRNGAGKTKRMRTLVGALRPLSGQIRFDDAEVGSRPGAARVRLGLGYMPEDRRLVPDLSVRANIALPLEVAGMAGRRDRAQDGLRAVADSGVDAADRAPRQPALRRPAETRRARPGQLPMGTSCSCWTSP